MEEPDRSSLPPSPNCTWTAALPLVPWIRYTSPISRTGSGEVTFEVTLNSGPEQSASLSVSGHSFTVYQQAASITSLGLIGSMPHLAAGGGWQTTFTFVNKGSAAASARPSFFASNGYPQSLLFNLPRQVSPTGSILGWSLDQPIVPNASFVLQATRPPDGSFVEGSAELAAAGSVDGFAIFHYNPSQQEAVVPLETRNANSYLLPFDNTNSLTTGMALENTMVTPVAVPVTVRDDAGTVLAAFVLQLDSFGHTSFVLSTQYAVTANHRGTVEFDSPTGARISVLGIRYTPPGTLTTIPAMANIGTTGGQIAHLAVSGGWQTTILLVNTGSASAAATLKVFGDDGTPLALPLTFPQGGAPATTSTFTQSISPNASLWLQSAGSASASLQTGSAQLTTTAKLEASSFSDTTQTGRGLSCR